MSVIERFRRPPIEDHEEVIDDHEIETVKTPRNFRFSPKKLNWRRFVSIPALAGLAVILIIAGIVIGRSIHHHDLNHKTGTITTASVKGAGAGSNTASNSTAKNTPSSNSSTTQKSTGGSTAQQPTQLANTGPGNVLAVFLLTSLAAGSAHAFVRSRR